MYAYKYVRGHDDFWEAGRRAAALVDRLGVPGPLLLELWRLGGGYVLTVYSPGRDAAFSAVARAALGHRCRFAESLEKMGVDVGRGPVLRRVLGVRRLDLDPAG
jgi:hypothetical protein